MNKSFLLLSLLFQMQILSAQIKEHIHELNPLENLLTDSVKGIINENIANKQIVFLGEAVHYSGSDLLAKTEFVKYLVNEHGYKDIAFESDFFALLFDHDKRNLYSMWSSSVQCNELMLFLKKNNVTIWGFDNRIYSYYSRKEFTNKLSDFLQSNEIVIDTKFKALADVIVTNEYESPKLLSKDDINYLKIYVSNLLLNEKIKSSKLWEQILKSFSSSIELYTVKDDNRDLKRIAIRDRQMANNLDFIVKQNPDKKFIVWLANGHMSKCNHKYMGGMTMGYQFRKSNPNNSYHIAFGTIRMPPEKSEKSIIKASKNENSILFQLPSIDHNYFINSSNIINDRPELKNRIFSDARIFNSKKKEVDILNHFDALVIIAKGIEVSYGNRSLQGL